MIQPTIISTENRSQTLALLIQQCGFDFPKLSPADKRLHWKRLQAALIQWQLSANGPKFTANRLQFMAYNVYGFTPAEFTAAFVGTTKPGEGGFSIREPLSQNVLVNYDYWLINYI